MIGDQVYLFDARLGLEVPGPGGQGVATLEQALSDPSILERMNLPGLAPYSTSRAALLSSPTKIGVLIDSSPGYFSPKMKLLQRELSGKYRTILFSDPAQQRDNFVHVLGSHAGAVSLWELPLQVEARLFTDPSTSRDPELPLLVQARIPPDLRPGQAAPRRADEAIEGLRRVPLRGKIFRSSPIRSRRSRKTSRTGSNVYATYYLALAHLERNNLKEAEDMFQPDPGHAARAGDPAEPAVLHTCSAGGPTPTWPGSRGPEGRAAAIDYYTQNDPTSQHVGNLLRARELVWEDPMAPIAEEPKAVTGKAPGWAAQADRQTSTTTGEGRGK